MTECEQPAQCPARGRRWVYFGSLLSSGYSGGFSSPPHSLKVSSSTLEVSCLFFFIFGHLILVHEIALGNVMGCFHCKIRFRFGVECRIGMTF